MAKKTNCEINGIKYYRLTVTVGEGPDGKRLRKAFYGANKTEAMEMRDAYFEELLKKEEQLKKEVKKEKNAKAKNNNRQFNIDTMTLSELMHTWLFTVSILTIRPNSFTKEEGDFRLYIKDSDIGKLLVPEIDSITIEMYYQELFNKGKSSQKIESIHKVLRKFFFYLEKAKLIDYNPCAQGRVSIPKRDGNTVLNTSGNVANPSLIVNTGKEDEVWPYDLEEWEKIKNQLRGTQKVLFTFLLASGTRLGEATGLTENDLNFHSNNFAVSINKALKKEKIYNPDGSYYYRISLGPPKTESSYRDVPLPESIVPILKNHIAAEKRKCLSLGIPYSSDRLIFTTCDGMPFDQKNLGRAWERIQKRAKVPYRKIHCLRHTYVSTLAQMGTPIEVVSALIGHSDVSMTQKIYLHLWPKRKTDEVNKLNYLFETDVLKMC